MANIAIVGIRRSGIHAIASYIADQMDDPFILNDVYPELSYWYHKRDVSKAKDVIAIFEDRTLTSVKESRLLEWFEPDCFILVLRDPLNLLASRYKQFLDAENKPRRRQRRIKLMFRLRGALRLYPQYCREFLGNTNILGGVIPVNYNRFVEPCTDEDCERARFGRLLGLPDPAYFPLEIQLIADGSSFDQMNLSGKANEMKVLERWRVFQNDPDYLKLFSGRVMRVARMIYGDDLGKELDLGR